jgi:hypothetical protein
LIQGAGGLFLLVLVVTIKVILYMSKSSDVEYSDMTREQLLSELQLLSSRIVWLSGRISWYTETLHRVENELSETKVQLNHYREKCQDVDSHT